MTIVETIKSHVDTAPDKIFCHFYRDGIDEALSYRWLWQRASDYAAALDEQKIAPGAVVIIMLRHVPDLYATFIGAMMHGAIPSFMPPPTSKQDPILFWDAHRQLFARIQPQAMIINEELREGMRGAAGGVPTLYVESITPAGIDRDSPLPNVDTKVAFLQHSSGTTGLKKGVMLSHDAVLTHVRSYGEELGIDAGSVIASWLPLYHDMGLIACFMMPVLLGSTVVHLDALEWVANPLTILDVIEKHRGNYSWMPNFAFSHLALNRRRQRERRWDLSSFEAFLNCSEPCKAESMAAFVNAFADSGAIAATTQVCYAMAETVFAVTQTSIGAPVRALQADRDALLDNRYRPAASTGVSIVSCGTPIDGVYVRIMAGEKEAADGEIGEITITGPSLYQGYYRLPDVTAERLVDGWHRSGDLGFLHEGELYVTGRKDDLILVRGRNFYAHDLEAMIAAVQGVKPGRCVVFAVDNAVIGTSEVVCLAEPDGEQDIAQLRRAIRSDVESLSSLALGRVEIVEPGMLVKTTSGKISREKNKALYEQGYYKAV